MEKCLAIVFNDLDIGGIQTKIVDLCRHYSRTDTQVYLLLKIKTGPNLIKIPDNVHVRVSRDRPLPINNFFFPFWLFSQFLKIQPGLILAFGNFSSICSLIANIFIKKNIIISEDSSIDVQLQTDSFSFIRTFLVKALYPLATKIIVLTPIARIKLKKLVPKSKIIIIPNWLPLSYSPASNLTKDIDILFVGRFEPQKNPLLFLQICRHLKKYRLTMVGQGSLLPRIKKYIRKYHLNINLVPATTDIAMFYRRSKILLLTSSHEGFPLTILESISQNCLPLTPRLVEIEPFFQKYYPILTYTDPLRAVARIKYFFKNPSSTKQILKYFRSSIFSDQKLNFQKTINLLATCLS